MSQNLYNKKFQKINFDYGTEKYYLLNHLPPSMYLSTAADIGTFYALEIISSGPLVTVFCQQFKLPYFIVQFLSAGLQLLNWLSIFQKYFWTHDRIFHFWQRILIVHIKHFLSVSLTNNKCNSSLMM